MNFKEQNTFLESYPNLNRCQVYLYWCQFYLLGSTDKIYKQKGAELLQPLTNCFVYFVRISFSTDSELLTFSFKM
jgi:hypothetical protein